MPVSQTEYAVEQHLDKHKLQLALALYQSDVVESGVKGFSIGAATWCLHGPPKKHCKCREVADG